MSLKIEKLEADSWKKVRAIYEEGIATNNATFQTVSPTWEQWDLAHVTECRFVAISNGEISGWVALSRISTREVYSGVAEVSIYIGEKYRGKGIGSSLLKYIINASEEFNFWTLQSGIFPENAASIHVHRKLGFEIVGVRKRIGKLHGQWRDVVLMERRSSKVGID